MCPWTWVCAWFKAIFLSMHIIQNCNKQYLTRFQIRVYIFSPRHEETYAEIYWSMYYSLVLYEKWFISVIPRLFWRYCSRFTKQSKSNTSICVGWNCHSYKLLKIIWNENRCRYGWFKVIFSWRWSKRVKGLTIWWILRKT
jgi:hypothetical protein